MTQHQTAGSTARAAARERNAELIGDGTNLTADDFAGMTYAQRAQLHTVNTERYRELQAEQDRAGAFGGGR